MSGNDYELLSAYIDDALSAAERTELETRLQAEPRLRQELATLRQTVTLVRDLPDLKTPRDFTLTPRMIRQPLPFPLSATFSALSTAAAILLFAFGGYFLLQSNSALLNTNSPNLLASTSTENQVAAVPTILREAAPAASPIVLETVSNDESRQTQPGSIASNAQDSVSLPTPTALATPLLQQLENEAVEEGQLPDVGGGAAAELEYFATDGTLLADDQARPGDLADADNESSGTLEESGFEQSDGEFARGTAEAAPDFEPFPQNDGPTFRLAPPMTPEASMDALSAETAVAQAPAPSILDEATRDDAEEEDQNIAAELPEESTIEATTKVAESSITISLGLLLAGGLLLLVAILTTAIRRRRQSL